MTEFNAKSQFINGLTGKLQKLLVKDDNTLEKPMNQITCRVTNVKVEIGVSLKESPVNSQPPVTHLYQMQQFKKMIAREVAKKLEEAQVQAIHRYPLSRLFLEWVADQMIFAGSVELLNQREASSEKLEIADTVRPQSAIYTIAHVKICPDTRCYVTGDIDGWKTTKLLDSRIKNKSDPWRTSSAEVEQYLYCRS